MTTDSNDAGEPAVKPQVIDLDAEDVTVTPEPPPPPVPPRPRKSRGSARWIVAALILGAIAGGWFYRDILAAYLPTSEMTGLTARIATLEANSKTTGEQLLAVSASADRASQTAAALDASVKQTATGLADARTALGDFDSRLAATEKSAASLKSDLDSLRAAVAAGGTSGGAPDAAALAAIGQRLDQLEKDVASLKSGGGTSEDAAAKAALSQALSDIKAKIATGAPYQSELDRITRMVPAVAGLGIADILNAYAANGLPTASGLAAELRASIPTLPQPDKGTPASGGYFDSFWNAVTSVVTIRDIGETDWPSLAEETAKLAETGDLAQAIARVDAAEGSVPSAISQWRERAAARLKLEAAVNELSQAVEGQIAALGGGQ